MQTEKKQTLSAISIIPLLIITAGVLDLMEGGIKSAAKRCMQGI